MDVTTGLTFVRVLCETPLKNDKRHFITWVVGVFGHETRSSLASTVSCCSVKLTPPSLFSRTQTERFPVSVSHGFCLRHVPLGDQRQVSIIEWTWPQMMTYWLRYISQQSKYWKYFIYKREFFKTFSHEKFSFVEGGNLLLEHTLQS